MRYVHPYSAATLSLLLIAGCGEPSAEPEEVTTQASMSVAAAEQGQCGDFNPLKNPYFGDLHVHTMFSFDAFTFGTRNGPAAAYAFAQGAELTLTGGATAQIDRELDFAAVTDHGEGLTARMWRRSQAVTNAAYQPCELTTFNAYEWSGKAESGGNLHRNVIFADSRVPMTRPIHSRTESSDTPEELWQALDDICWPQGLEAPNACDVIAIPHNSNQSKGLKFAVAEHPEEIAERRARLEVLAEVFQGKGSSECLNTVDPSDEGYDPHCNFELLPDTVEPRDAPGYVRAGLGQGLLYYDRTGINPVQTGLIGSTDTHNATAGHVREDDWPGNHGNGDDTPRERLVGSTGRPRGVNNPGGLAVVWAEQNTRQSIFSALKRREAYATSGPRMIVRFYQTWEDGPDPCTAADLPAHLGAGAVPMGATMPTGPAGAKPRFVIHAARDEIDLAAAHVIKGSVVDGELEQQVILLAPPSGGSAATICRSWTDEAYDPAVPAFYYARVLQTPTWRWSHYDCLEAPGACRAGGVERLNVKVQERAWTSPIWNMP